MVDVVTSGTGGSVNFGGMSIAGKTGTTSDYVDVWFAGYTPYYTATTWAGYDNTITTNKLTSTEQKNLAKKIWRAVMSEIHAELPNESFPTPSGIVTATVCSQSGKLPIPGLCDGTLKTEYFEEGTVPQETCNVHYAGLVCAHDLLPASEECPFKTNGVLVLNPDSLTPTATDENGEATVPDPVADPNNPLADPNQPPTPTTFCQHNAQFFATPGYEAVLQQHELEIQAAGMTYGVVPEQPAEQPAEQPTE